MALMVVCGLLAAAGVAAIAAWGGYDIVSPPATPAGRRPVTAALRRYLWWINLVIIAGLAAGVVAAGAGGRLVMRLLAATSPDARGAITEADQTVGKITVGGTVGFVVFGALPFAVLAAFVFALAHRWLPTGRLAGLLFGTLLLVAAGTRLEPLRSDNPDFRLLGPTWLAVLTFGLVVLVDGMITAALMGWYSRHLPLPAAGWAVSWHYVLVPLLLLFLVIVAAPVVISAAAGAVIVAVLARLAPTLSRAWASRRTTLAGRVVLAGWFAVALPGFVTAISDIVP
jgi:hypothetical protein